MMATVDSDRPHFAHRYIASAVDFAGFPPALTTNRQNGAGNPRLRRDVDANSSTTGSLSYTLVVIMFTSLLQSCTGFFQTRDQALIREPGHRVYGPAVAVGREATKHWEFAWLSEAAYGKTAGAEPDVRQTSGVLSAEGNDLKVKAESGTCPESAVVLEKAMWTQWKDFPDAELSNRFLESNLRVQVWEKRDPSTVVVAFGGTIFTSGKDWRSNLRWFTPHHQDEYTQTVGLLGPAFAQSFLQEAEKPGKEYLKHAQLVTTGHSLGGGLAQQFAYSLPRNPLVPRVTQVYAFDPSPVTGYYSVAADTRDANRQGLKIDRIFEREEVLAAVRSIMSLLYPPSAENPSIRAVRYSLFYTWNLITGHSIAKLACQLYIASGHSAEP